MTDKLKPCPYKIIDERGAEVLRHDRCIRTLHKKLETAKAEAYKECIERVKEIIEGCHYIGVHNDLDNLLKELIGGGGCDTCKSLTCDGCELYEELVGEDK
jgi:hypothetical protein